MTPCKIVDMHCDTISELRKKRNMGWNEGLQSNKGHLDLERMREQGYLLQNMALFVNQGECSDPWEEFLVLEKLYREELQRNYDRVRPVFSYEDIERNEREGCLSVMLTAEEGQICGGEKEKLRQMYRMGVRMMTITWNYPNCLGYPAKAGVLPEGDSAKRYGLSYGEENGLTDLGRELVREMEQLGMIIDVSHLSDRGFYEVLELTTKPFVASHSNARGLCPHPRNMTDEMIRRLGERGGCMGLNFYQEFLRTKDSELEEIQGGMEDLVRHAKHIIHVGGGDVLGLGSDFDGIDTNPDIPDVTAMERIWERLHRAGFSQGQLDKIFHENVLRVYREVL